MLAEIQKTFLLHSKNLNDHISRGLDHHEGFEKSCTEGERILRETVTKTRAGEEQAVREIIEILGKYDSLVASHPKTRELLKSSTGNEATTSHDSLVESFKALMDGASD